MTVDLIVLGSGAAAQSVAYTCREAGWSVTVVDSDPFGGTCSLRGCDPKKVLVGVSELVDWGRRMQGKGLSAPAPALAWSEMLRFKRTFVDDVPAAMDQSFKDAGMLTVHGRARFVDSTSLRVGDETYVGNHVVIAAGARHAPLGIAGEEYLTTSTGFLELDELPRRVVFVGGGYIAFEFAHIAARRVPEVDDLGLEEAGVARAESGGVAVNEYLQSVSNPAVYAAGEAVASGGLPLTPVAGMQGRIVAANLLNGNTRTPNYVGIPTVVFTTPPLARVGLDEATARARGLRFTTHHVDTSGWYSSRRVALAHTGFKTLVEDGTERVLGAHLLGVHAE